MSEIVTAEVGRGELAPGDGRIITLELSPAHGGLVRRRLGESLEANRIEIPEVPARPGSRSLVSPTHVVRLE
jgi:hypothetical protein